jgi:hypothetical protein
MPSRKSRVNMSSTPQQTTFIEPQPQVKNGDILDVDEAAILLNINWRCSRYGLMKSYTMDFKSSEKSYDHIWNTTPSRTH